MDVYNHFIMLLNRIIDSPRKLLFIVVSLFVSLSFISGVPFIYSDGYCYYHIARSIHDHSSFVSPYQPEYFDYKGHVIEEYRGNHATVCSPGTGMILYPGITISKLLFNEGTIYDDYFKAFNGHSFTDGLSVLVTANVFAIATIILLYKLLREGGFSHRVALISIAGGYLSSYAFWYVFLQPSYTHTYELFMVTLSTFFFQRYTLSKKKKHALFAGLAIGFAFMIRPLAVVPGGLFILILLYKRNFKATLLLILGTVPSGLLWMLYNFVSYGNLISSGYREIRGEHFTLSEFNAHNVLLSAERGWLIYSPLFFIAVAGLLILVKRKHFFGLAGLAFVLITAIFYGFWPAWNGGGSYGSRFLIMLLPFAVFGVASFIKWRPKEMPAKILLLIIILTTSWSLVIAGLYRITPEYKIGNKIGGYVITDFLTYNFDRINTSTSLKQLADSIVADFSGGNSIAGILIGLSDPVLRIDERDSTETKIRFLLPPIYHSELPEHIDLIIYDDFEQKIFYGKLFNPTDQDSFTILCPDICTQSGNLTFEEIPDRQLALSKLTHKGFFLSDTNRYHLFYVRSGNIQMHGRPIYLKNDEPNYIINIPSDAVQ